MKFFVRRIKGKLSSGLMALFFISIFYLKCFCLKIKCFCLKMLLVGAHCNFSLRSQWFFCFQLWALKMDRGRKGSWENYSVWILEFVLLAAGRRLFLPKFGLPSNNCNSHCICPWRERGLLGPSLPSGWHLCGDWSRNRNGIWAWKAYFRLWSHIGLALDVTSVTLLTQVD